MTISQSRSIVLLLVALVLSGCAAAGGLKDRAKEAAQQAAGQAVAREVGERTDAAVSGAFDKAEEAVRCAAGDDACIEAAKEEGKPVVVTDEEGDVVQEIPGEAGTAPVENANANYDFEAGTRVLFEEDFSNDNVGDFPRRLEFVKGNWEIVTWQSRRFLRNLGPRHAAFKVPLPETLPERFTIEFETSFPHSNQQLAVATVEPERGSVNHLEDQNFFHVTNNQSGLDVRGDGVEARQRLDDPFASGVVPVRIMVDGSYAKVYVGEQRVANVPNAVLPRSNTVWFENTYFADAEHPIYIGNIRIAAGGRDLYGALEKEGRVTVNDILFDTGSDQIRPSSSEVLGQIGQMLKAHPDLRLRIEGHTDSEGGEAANRQLSQQRAEAVKRFLMSGHGIDAARLDAVGKGEAEPVASNDTPDGRQQNRRVELVRIDGTTGGASGGSADSGNDEGEDTTSGEARAAWGAFPGLHGVYGNPSRPSGRAGRRFFISETCGGQLAVGAMWGDVAPWILTRVSDGEYEAPPISPGGEGARLRLQSGADAQPASLTFLTLFEEMGRLERLDDLPAGWGECINLERR